LDVVSKYGKYGYVCTFGWFDSGVPVNVERYNMISKKEEMEMKAKKGEIPGVSRFAVFDEDGNLFLDMD